MTELEIFITAESGAILPEYRTEGAAGADVCAYIASPMTIPPGTRAAIPTGIRMAIPIGFEVQIRPRSGLAIEKGVTCLNSPGTIDSDYRGEVKVILINLGEDDFIIRSGDRIAQMVISRCNHATFHLKPTLDTTERGFGGFGSTGI